MKISDIPGYYYESSRCKPGEQDRNTSPARGARTFIRKELQQILSLPSLNVRKIRIFGGITAAREAWIFRKWRPPKKSGGQKLQLPSLGKKSGRNLRTSKHHPSHCHTKMRPKQRRKESFLLTFSE